MDDQSLLVFPLLSAVTTAIAAASFALPVWLAFSHRAGLSHMTSFQHLAWAPTLLCYFILYSSSTFFNTALIAVVLARFRGQRVSLGDGLAVALRRLPTIFGYCLIAASVGTLLRIIEERVGFIGRIIIGLLGFTFSVATTLVVPIIANSEHGPIDAIEQSVELMKRSWGENIIGNQGISFAAFCMILAVLVVGGGATVMAISAQDFILAMLLAALAVCALLLTFLISAAMHTIYSAALYRFASGEGAGPFFTDEVLVGAYRAR